MTCEACFSRDAARAVVANIMGVRREYRVCLKCRDTLQKIERKYSNTPLPERQLTPAEYSTS